MDNTNIRPPEDRLILVAVAELMLAFADEPDPPKWKTWERSRLEDAKRWGPEWRPSLLFAGGERLPAADLVRFRRSLHRLSGEGLVRLTTMNGRLKNVRLRPKAVPIVAALADFDADDVAALELAVGDEPEDDDDGDN